MAGTDLGRKIKVAKVLTGVQAGNREGTGGTGTIPLGGLRVRIPVRIGNVNQLRGKNVHHVSSSSPDTFPGTRGTNRSLLKILCSAMWLWRMNVIEEARILVVFYSI